MDTKPEYITNFYNSISKKVNLGSKILDVNKLIASYLFNKQFFRFLNIFPNNSIEPNELIRANTIVEGYSKTHAIKHLEWIVNNYYPNCIWFRHKKYKHVRTLLRDRMVKPTGKKDTEKISARNIYKLSINKPMNSAYDEKKSNEIVHFLKESPKILFYKNYYELPTNNPLYKYTPGSYYPKLIYNLATNRNTMFNSNYKFDPKCFTRDMIINICTQSANSLKFIPKNLITPEIIDELIKIDIDNIDRIPHELISREHIIGLLDICVSNWYCRSTALGKVMNKINPDIIIDIIRNTEYVDIIRNTEYVDIIASSLRTDHYNKLTKTILEEYPHTIKSIDLYSYMSLEKSEDEIYIRLFMEFPKAKCLEFIKYIPRMIPRAPFGYYTNEELIGFLQKRKIRPIDLSIGIFNKELCELLHTTSKKIFISVVKDHPGLLKLFTSNELKTKYFYLFKNMCPDYKYYVPDDFFDEPTIRSIIAFNKKNIHDIPIDKLTVEFCKELLDARTYNACNMYVEIFSKLFAAKSKANN